MINLIEIDQTTLINEGDYMFIDDIMNIFNNNTPTTLRLDLRKINTNPDYIINIGDIVPADEINSIVNNA